MMRLQFVMVTVILMSCSEQATTSGSSKVNINFDPDFLGEFFGKTPNGGQNIVTTAKPVTPVETPIFTPTVTPTLTPTLTPSLTPTVTPTVTPRFTPGVTPPVTPTIITNGDRRNCKCVYYKLCDENNRLIYDNYAAMTGASLIGIRFNSEQCDTSLDVCCTVPNTTTETTNLNPNPTDPNPMNPNPTDPNPTDPNPTNPPTTKPNGTNPPTAKPNATNPPTTKPRGCGYNNPNGIGFTLIGDKIGAASQFGEFPWVVAIMNGRNFSYIGVGVLIHPQVVITAAHIVMNYKDFPTTINVRAGEWDTKIQMEPLRHQEMFLQKIYIHPGFNSRKLTNDIAFLHLALPLELDAHINTICLPDAGEVFDDSKNCVANGWGKNRFGKDDEFAVVLKKIELDMVEHSRCNDLLRYTELGARYNLHSSFVCAGGEEGKDMCTGDGGGPLACPISNNRYKLAGLVAGGVGCGQKNVPGVYASLAALRSWVDEIMRLIGYGTSFYTV